MIGLERVLQHQSWTFSCDFVVQKPAWHTVAEFFQVLLALKVGKAQARIASHRCAVQCNAPILEQLDYPCLSCCFGRMEGTEVLETIVSLEELGRLNFAVGHKTPQCQQQCIF